MSDYYHSRFFYNGTSGNNPDGSSTKNPVIKINYAGSGNNSQFGYDPFGWHVLITETTSGTQTSFKEFVRTGFSLTEERNRSGGVTAQFFGYGERINGQNFYWTTDHLGSIREMADSTGTIVNENKYDPFGNITVIKDSTISDFQYAGYYTHSRGREMLTANRVYVAKLGRWLSRDPAGEKSGVNLYAYVANNPVTLIDPSGLGPEGAILGGLAGSILGGAGGATIGGTAGAIAGPGGIVIGGGEGAVGGAIAGAGAGAVAGSAIQDMGNAMAGGFMDGCRRLGNAIRANIMTPKPPKDCDAIYQAEVQQATAHYDLMKNSDPENAAIELSYELIAAELRKQNCIAGLK